MIRTIGCLALLATLATLATSAAAQAPAHDPSTRLREVLPAEVADKVLAKIAEARSRDLPAAALEQRALKFAARGVKPEDIERSVTAQAQRMERTSQVLEQARGRRASDEEVDAGAEAMRMGVDGAQIAELAKSVPSGRSLDVPLLVIGSLIDRGLPADEALSRVQLKLQQRASDMELERMPGDVAGRPAETGGKSLANTKRPDAAGRPAAGGPPAGVPANAGSGARPTTGQMPGPAKKPAIPRPPRP